ncbi:sensor histidine kinase [Streptomyces radicis]|uniref:histidine kinase n=1 Tax=Streptomyces radicis TaxID=1750517 RepID=A0A3A9WIM9_9ACTN|nr:histidine kinase [Streptomyces radicis]RKN12878.1 two-component sensor histidine kinase [Streptomyces radicis]RKN27357.1 two-component sensor histidine kinase [Streptomyces radicis]
MIPLRLSRTRLLDLLLAAVAVLPALVDQVTTDTSRPAWTALTIYAVVALGALSVRKRWPLAGLAVVLVTLAGVAIWSASQEAQLGNLVVLPLAFSVYAVGAYCPLTRAFLALVGAALIVCVGVAINHATAPLDWRGGSDVFATVAPVPVAWALGVVMQSHRLTLSTVRQRAADAEREHHLLADRAAAAERVRIARDMHDVVAHSLTLLVVHAETIRARSGELPVWAREQVDSLAVAGRQATVEMRELLGLLRNGTADEAPRAPAPSLGDLPALVEAARLAGNEAELRVAGEREDLPKPLQLTCYRVVQESLANARRHAAGSAVRVDLEITSDAVRVEVVSGPSRARGREAMPRGAGVGLQGMRERVATLGGELSAGRTGEGGFRVAARIPRQAPGLKAGERERDRSDG